MIKVVLNSIHVQNSPLLLEFAAPEGYMDLTEFAFFFEEKFGFKLTSDDFKDSTKLARWIKQFKARKGEFSHKMLPVARELFPKPTIKADSKVVVIDLDGLYVCRTYD